MRSMPDAPSGTPPVPALMMMVGGVLMKDAGLVPSLTAPPGVPPGGPRHDDDDRGDVDERRRTGAFHHGTAEDAHGGDDDSNSGSCLHGRSLRSSTGRPPNSAWLDEMGSTGAGWGGLGSTGAGK